jgi:hypothetical protein
LSILILRSSAIVVPSSYSTTFPLTENPLSESGNWLGGATDGLDWLDFQTGSGNAYASAASGPAPPTYNDSVAILKSSAFAAANDQYAEIVVRREAGYAPDADSLTHENGMFVRAAVSANSITGYEAYVNCGGNFGIVLWNGAAGDFTPLSVTGVGPGVPADGDRYRFGAQGTSLIFWEWNGSSWTQVGIATDATIASGQPGMQSFADVGTTFANYGSASFAAGNL